MKCGISKELENGYIYEKIIAIIVDAKEFKLFIILNITITTNFVKNVSNDTFLYILD